jgi:hypothetical protein
MINVVCNILQFAILVYVSQYVGGESRILSIISHVLNTFLVSGSEGASSLAGV